MPRPTWRRGTEGGREAGQARLLSSVFSAAGGGRARAEAVRRWQSEPVQAIDGNIPFGHNYDCVTFLWPRRLVWSSAHYNFCLSVSPLSIPFPNEREERERTPAPARSLSKEGGVVALYKEIRGYIDIGRLLLLRLRLRLLRGDITNVVGGVRRGHCLAA